MAGKQTTLELALRCAKCMSMAPLVEECTLSEFSPGEITLIECPNVHCKEKPWVYCNSCKKKCYKNGLLLHAQRKKHIEAHKRAYPEVAMPAPPPDPPAISNGAASPGPIQGFSERMMDDIDFEELLMDGMDAEDFEKMDMDLSTTHMENATTAMETSAPTSSVGQSVYPYINMAENEWLAKLMHDSPPATTTEILQCFDGDGMDKMRNFWLAERASGDGHCGGGIVYLSAKTFQQVRDSQLDKYRLPSFVEAKWQFMNCIQYQSMTEKQRIRQSILMQTSHDCKSSSSDSFFKETFVPVFNQLGRYYGNTGQHSILNNLPTPRSRNVGGVAYVSPRNILAFLMANGIPIDNVHVDFNDPNPLPYRGRVHNSSECQKAIDRYNGLKSQHYRVTSNSGAPNSNSGAPNFSTVIPLSVSDWADGFGPGKVKNNRNSIDCKSFTVSPPKHLVNSGRNTFAVALGPKKAPGWSEVERLFRAELEEITSAPKLTMFYNGVIQKCIPCAVRRFAVLSDKAERNGLTGTLGCGGDTHRRFGISGKIQTPACKVKDLERYLHQEVNGRKKAYYGWSDKFVVSDGDANGAVFPACGICRKHSLRQIGIDFGDGSLPMSTEPSSCSRCANWELLPENTNSVCLDFPAHKDYPRRITDGSPVAPPTGRDMFGEETRLPFVQLSWDLMKTASRFAFFQASRPRHAWTKSMTTCYLKLCGISNDMADKLFSAAKSCAKAKTQDDINYSQFDGIGDFQFPASWLSNEISVQDYIEAPMHQLFLGVAESGYELILRWLADSPPAAKVGVAPFKAVLQKLIRDLRGFMLSWLGAYPLTGKKGNLGTGSWVAENWIFFARVSQFVFGWCIRDHATTKKHGVDDMSRMVISYHALLARLLTHGGVDEKHIAKTRLYMNEFLSTVRELDIRARYRSLNASVSSAAERKRTEAWWLKPNYMSLPNLLVMMKVLGPLVEWWDGGFKGERFIQVVKPYLKKGVRDDIDSFFTNIMDKLYQSEEIDLLEKLYRMSTKPNHDENDITTLLDILDELDISGTETTDTESTTDNPEDSGDEDKENNDDEVKEQDAQFTVNEAIGMTKTRTIYVYRNERQLDEAIKEKKPLAGIVEVTQLDGKTAFEFELIFRNQ